MCQYASLDVVDFYLRVTSISSYCASPFLTFSSSILCLFRFIHVTSLTCRFRRDGSHVRQKRCSRESRSNWYSHALSSRILVRASWYPADRPFDYMPDVVRTAFCGSDPSRPAADRFAACMSAADRRCRLRKNRHRGIDNSTVKTLHITQSSVK